MKHQTPQTRVWNKDVTNLLLFPDDSSPSREALPLANAPLISGSSPSRSFPLSLPEILAEWQMLLKRLGRRRRVLESMLTAGQPIRLTDDTLVVGFSPQCRFHRELLDMPEYRGCVEEELTRTFQVRLSLVTTLYPEKRQLQHRGTFGKTPA